MDDDTSSGGDNRSGQRSKSSSSSTQRHGGGLGDTASSKAPLTEEERKERRERKKERLAEQKRKSREDKSKEEGERKMKEDAARKMEEEEAERKMQEEAERKMQEEAERKMQEEAEKKMQEDAERKKKDDEDERKRLQDEKEKQGRSGQRKSKKKNTTTFTIGQFLEMGNLDASRSQMIYPDSELSVSGEGTIAEVKVKEKAVVGDTELALLFEDVLKHTKRTDDGNNGKEPFYPSLVAQMKKLGSYVLTVDFMDLLTKKENKDLVIRIGKKDEYGWLFGTVARFLSKNGMGDVGEEKLKKMVSLSFTNKKRLQDAKTFMQSKGRWAVRQDKKTPVTAHGQSSFTLVIENVLDKHIRNLTYDGKFKEEDILLGCDYCHIYGELFMNQSNLGFSSDYKVIWSVMAPYYEVADHGRIKIYAHNFSQLKDTLTFDGIHPSEVKTACYREFVRYHTTLASPEAKRYLTMELRRIVKDHPVILSEPFLSCSPSPSISWTYWGDWVNSRNEDWRDDMDVSNDPVESGVYRFDPERKNASGKVQQTPSKRSSGSGTETNTSNFQKYTGRKRFKNTVWGMLDHRRCLIEHGKDYADYPFPVEGTNWTELHASERQPNLIPFVVYSMLKKNIFANPRFGALWEKYKALFPVADTQ